MNIILPDMMSTHYDTYFRTSVYDAVLNNFNTYKEEYHFSMYVEDHKEGKDILMRFEFSNGFVIELNYITYDLAYWKCQPFKTVILSRLIM